MDAQVAPFAHRIGIAALERLVAEAIARYMPDRAAEDAAKAADGRHFTIEHAAGLVQRHQPDHRRARPRRRPGPRRCCGPRCRDSSRRSGRPSPSTYAAPRPPARSPGTSSALDLTEEATGWSSSERSERTDETTTPSKRTRPRQVVLYVHLSEAAITGTSNGLELARVENQRQVVTADQIRTWCASPDAQVTVKPVIDLNEHIHVEGYEVPGPPSRAGHAAGPHLRVPLVHPVSPQGRRRPRHPVRRGRHHLERQHRTTVSTSPSTQDPFVLDLHDARTRVVPVVEPARLPVPSRPPRHPRCQSRQTTDRTIPGPSRVRTVGTAATYGTWSRLIARFARCSTTGGCGPPSAYGTWSRLIARSLAARPPVVARRPAPWSRCRSLRSLLDHLG